MLRRVALLAAAALLTNMGSAADPPGKEAPKTAPAGFNLGALFGEPAPATKTEVKPIVAVIGLGGALSEAPAGEDLFTGQAGVTLRELIARLRKAGDDPNVKAVVLMTDGIEIGRAQIEEVRQALENLRVKGKEILAHGDTFTMQQYMLVAGANRISIVPTGDLWLTGLYGETMYLRGLFDLVGVKPDFLTCGEFKSAAEMYMRTGPSPEAEQMQNWLLDSLYESSVALIASGRGVGQAKAKDWINNGPYTAERAKSAGLIDVVEHRQDFNAYLKQKFGANTVIDKKYGLKKPPQVDFSNPFAILKVWSDLMAESTTKRKSNKPSVAVIYVEGGISAGGQQVSPFGMAGAFSTPIRKALDQAANDDSVKAVVLRVDSPGGSALASEIILDATRRVKAKKPFVVSMGNVAGSGGYYVACASDVIFADKATITGSIGVLGGKLATADMFKRVGVTFKEYKRGQNAGLLSSGAVFTDEERKKMRALLDEIYEVFKGHVTKSRGDRLKKPLEQLAGGRVFTGQQAIEFGLVDKIGTLNDAIAFIADKAKVANYEVRVIPEPKNFLEALLEENMGAGDDKPNQVDIGDVPVNSRRAGKSNAKLVETILPLLKDLDPNRAKSIARALVHLESLQREGVLLAMPEFFLGN